ncbi:MAG: hypothetical protein JXR10_11870 [Cyclobacteriaceae bacterium]
MKTILIYLITTMIAFSSMAQDEELPFREIPEAPSEFTAETVVVRMLEGLGFRYYWATEGLRPEDLSYQPSREARTALETLAHIHGLTQLVFNCVKGIPHASVGVEDWDFEKLRYETLKNLKSASDSLRSGNLKLKDLPIKFESSQQEYPFWNQINGPIEDAVWHTGLIVSFRRTSGNPYNSKASMFRGVLRE